MDAVNITNLSKKFIISHEKEALVRAILPSLLRPVEKEELWALRDITFDLKKGESLGIIGLNGAGKSVLLNILAGITTPTLGKVKSSGKVSTILTLGAGFHQELTGEENIFLNAAILGMTLKEIRQKFDSIVDFCGLDGFIDAPIQTYSTGMLMRMGFSIATHVDFDILLVDEIISVGDIQFREKSLNRLKEFRKMGKTIVVASQALDLIREITDKTVYLRKGAIEGLGGSDKITRMYEESIKGKESILLDENYVSNFIKQKKEEQSPDKIKGGWGLKFGTKEAEIIDVKLLNKDKKECHEFNTGEPMEVEVKYRVNKEIVDAHFGVAIFREDYIYCYGPNTMFDNLPIGRLSSGENKFSIYFPHLLLSRDTYFISVAIWEKEENYAYDYHCGFYKMVINGRKKDILFYQPYKGKAEITRRPGEASLEYDIDIKLMDKQGKECYIFKTGDSLRILADVIYGRRTTELSLKIYSDSDILCFIMDRRLRSHLTGKTKAKIEFDIPDLNLLTGRYYVFAEIKDKKGYVLVHKNKLKIFSVFSEKKDHGIVYMDHKWNLGEVKNEEIKQKT